MIQESCYISGTLKASNEILKSILKQTGSQWKEANTGAFFYQLEDERLHFVLTADDKETTDPDPHTENYNSLTER